MKKLFKLIPILFLILSCQEEGELTRTPQNIVPITPTAILKYYGTFEPTSGIAVAGEAKIYQEGTQYKVKLDNFSVSDGPDLKVYLSKAATPTDFVNLGNLTSQTVYPIPSSVNIEDYSHVLIHCQQYSHLFAIAELIQN
ncbi:DM13 domain-containing protein [Flavobacterium sp. AS60]|uniref:DM13 domain-containing protein n=1 Tax=Flavobacterium anseongense TaxID=2910677 RepID=UPI001F158009|nr:DM13 domain-containing protein [Flavobacterium sp. AS60]MCF6130317.1 DM13 domain-containing protein [Flavobacterium sp. AS60]